MENNGNILFNYYTNDEGVLVQISDSTTGHFRVTFNENNHVTYIENGLSQKKKHQFWIDEEIIFRSVIGKIEREVRVFNFDGVPIISNTESRNTDGLSFLSQYKVFDLNLWKEIHSESNESIVLVNEPASILLGKESNWNFRIKSKFGEYTLLKGKWNQDFELVGNIDSTKIEGAFQFPYTPVKELDTIRFVVLCESNNTDQRKSFYYELPIGYPHPR